MEKVIVTGINGFVGHHLADALINSGYEVVGVGREQSAAPAVVDKTSAYYSCDLADLESVRQLPLNQAKAIINLAGLAAVGPSFDNPDLYMRINTAVLDTVCRTMIEQKATRLRVVSISSGAVYATQQPMPLNEDSVLNEQSSPYAASKIAMEKLAGAYRDNGLDCVVARPFNHIGPGQGEGFILPDLFKKVSEAKSHGTQILQVGNLSTRRDYTDVRDVARAYVALIEKGSLDYGTYNVATGRSLSGEDILNLLLQELGETSLKTQVDPSLFRPSDAPNLYGDNSRLKQETGWTPQIDIQQTIADFVKSA